MLWESTPESRPPTRLEHPLLVSMSKKPGLVSTFNHLLSVQSGASIDRDGREICCGLPLDCQKGDSGANCYLPSGLGRGET